MESKPILNDETIDKAKAAIAETVAAGDTDALSSYTTGAIKHFAMLREGKRRAFLSGMDLAASIMADTALAMSERKDNAGASFCIQLAETVTKQAAMMRQMKTGQKGDQEPEPLAQFEIHRVTYDERAEETKQVLSAA